MLEERFRSPEDSIEVKDEGIDETKLLDGCTILSDEFNCTATPGDRVFEKKVALLQ